MTILKIIMVLYIALISWMCSTLFNTVKSLDISPKIILLFCASIILVLAGAMIITIGVILE